MNSPLQIAHRRLYPSLSDPSYLVLRSRRLILTGWIARLGRDLRVLDIGGRYQPYRPLLERRLRSYIGLDIERTEFVNVVGNGEALPFADASFDLVIATQVFEYLTDPLSAAKQIHAVLRDGGMLLASVAGLTPRFVDGELWRFTAPGIRSLFSSFSTVETVPELARSASLVRTINLGLYSFCRYKWLRLLYELTACPVLNASGLLLENMRLTSDDRFATNFSVRAIK